MELVLFCLFPLGFIALLIIVVEVGLFFIEVLDFVIKFYPVRAFIDTMTDSFETIGDALFGWYWK